MSGCWLLLGDISCNDMMLHWKPHCDFFGNEQINKSRKSLVCKHSATTHWSVTKDENTMKTRNGRLPYEHSCASTLKPKGFKTFSMKAIALSSLLHAFHRFSSTLQIISVCRQASIFYGQAMLATKAITKNTSLWPTICEPVGNTDFS